MNEMPIENYNLKEMYNIGINQPLYVYQVPMFMITVSTVLVVENGIILVNDNENYRFPTTMVKAGKETIPFAAIRSVKNDINIVLKRDSLIPVDFRSSPERSAEGNVVDIGLVCTLDIKDIQEDYNGKWVEVDFENKCLINPSIKMSMDYGLLLGRAIDIACLIKE